MGRQADDLTTFKLAIDCWKSEGNVVIDAANVLIAYAARLRAALKLATDALEAAPRPRQYSLSDSLFKYGDTADGYADWYITTRQAALHPAAGGDAE